MGIAIVTGASRGIGRACALELGRAGYEVWANYRSSSADAESLKAEIEAAGGACRLLQFDVGDTEAVAAALGDLSDSPPEVLVNNAGITRDGLFLTMQPEDWFSVIQTNLGAFFNVTQPVLKAMSRAKRGRIVTLASVSGQGGNKGQSNYAASKAGLIAATKSIAKEYGRWNILANAVSPGFIATDMTAELPEKDLAKAIPLRRFGGPEEVAKVVRFLASEDASYVTGAVINVNGGLYM